MRAISVIIGIGITAAVASLSVDNAQAQYGPYPSVAPGPPPMTSGVPNVFTGPSVNFPSGPLPPPGPVFQPYDGCVSCASSPSPAPPVDMEAVAPRDDAPTREDMNIPSESPVERDIPMDSPD
jgi:hypothetical protein